MVIPLRGHDDLVLLPVVIFSVWPLLPMKKSIPWKRRVFSCSEKKFLEFLWDCFI